ncbi:hypothetical protein MMC30_008872 [Trapelia coarctata]|nr:hypothetical protein [Trapelia coarctata]
MGTIASGSQRSSIGTPTEEEFANNSIADDELAQASPSEPLRDRHILRGDADSIDRYHGPGTLFTLCNNFRDTTSSTRRKPSSPSTKDESRQNNKHNRSAGIEPVEDLLDRMCLEASIEESSLDLQSDHTPIRLPPKQFLLVVQTQFFQQVNHMTDIFVQSRFRSNVEQIYSRPFSPTDEAWAICFKTIILLVLGSEILTQGNDSLFGSQFALSFLSTVRTALSNPHFLMAPRLINVQALALLSIAARQYYPPGFAESILAQACVLARTMGLHQTCAVQDGVSPEEMHERINVFRSLYLQDKSFSISRGSICWLPSYDCSLSSGISQSPLADSKWAARIQLAKLQEEVYRLLHSAGSQSPSSAKHKGALSRIEQSLGQWANTHDILDATTAGTDNVDLKLEFLATRVSALSGSLEPSHARQTLSDSRLSCVLLLTSYGKSDQSVAGRLDVHLQSKGPSESLHNNPNTRSSKSNGTSSSAAQAMTSEPAPMQLHSLLDAFSIPAFFILAKNIIWPVLAHDGSQAEDDLDLLQKACACYREFDIRIQTSNHTQKVGRAFERLLEVVHLIKSPQQSYGTRQSSNLSSPTNTQMLFGASQGLSEFNNVPVSSNYATPPLSLDGFSKKNTPRTAMETASTITTSGLMTPAEQQYISLPFDTLGQRLLSTHLQQQDMRPPSRKRRLMSESEAWMDDESDSRLLSDFLTAGSDMSFDFTS